MRSKDPGESAAAWPSRISGFAAGSPTGGSAGLNDERGGSARAKIAGTGDDLGTTTGCRPGDCSCDEPTTTRMSSVVVTQETVQVSADGSTRISTKTVAANALDQSTAQLMGDAPACDVCGSITVRNGTCYRCLNCGNSMGCS